MQGHRLEGQVQAEQGRTCTVKEAKNKIMNEYIQQAWPRTIFLVEPPPLSNAGLSNAGRGLRFCKGCGKGIAPTIARVGTAWKNGHGILGQYVEHHTKRRTTQVKVCVSLASGWRHVLEVIQDEGRTEGRKVQRFPLWHGIATRGRDPSLANHQGILGQYI